MLIVLAGVLCIRTFVAEATVIPTGSMELTILIGDHVFLNKLLYGPRLPYTSLRMPPLHVGQSVRRHKPGTQRTPRVKPHAPRSNHAARSELVFAYRDVQRAIRDNRWKLIRYPQINKMQLFDMPNDPYELHDLAGKPESAGKVQDLTVRLEKALKAYGDKCALSVPNPNPAAWSQPAKNTANKN